jgi:hypothetical protein
MVVILNANKVNVFVSSVLFVFWFHSPNVLDTPHICNISRLRVNCTHIIVQECNAGGRELRVAFNSGSVSIFARTFLHKVNSDVVFYIPPLELLQMIPQAFLDSEFVYKVIIASTRRAVFWGLLQMVRTNLGKSRTFVHGCSNSVASSCYSLMHFFVCGARGGAVG